MCFKGWSLRLLQEQAIGQQILHNMLGRPELEQEHRGILQAFQGADDTRLSDVLVNLADMGLVKDEGCWAQELKVARQQLEQVAEVSPVDLSGANRVPVRAHVCPAAGGGGGGEACASMQRAHTHITQMQ